jgi:hypothetical protein
MRIGCEIMEGEVGLVAEELIQRVLALAGGRDELLVFVACHDAEALYDYLESGIGSLPGVRQIESAPLIRNSKRAGTPPV